MTLNLDNYPYIIMWCHGYKNISKQVLHLGGSDIMPSEAWSLIKSERWLSEQQVNNRGAYTDILIREGYIGYSMIKPIIPSGYLYIQSWELDSETNEYPWFQVLAREIESDTEDVCSCGLGWMLKRVPESSIPSRSIINYSIALPYNISILSALSDEAGETISNFGKVGKYAMSTCYNFESDKLEHTKIQSDYADTKITRPLAISKDSLLMYFSPKVEINSRIFITVSGLSNFIKLSPSVNGNMYTESVSFEYTSSHDVDIVSLLSTQQIVPR